MARAKRALSWRLVRIAYLSRPRRGKITASAFG